MSKELVDYNLSLDYSKFIWGICKCWGLHSSRWPALKNLWLKYYEKEKNINNPYDGPVEEYIKTSTKYVIMPYRSLILEQLSNGCNSIDDPNYPGYKEWFLSFNSNKKKGDYNYNKKMPYHWRYDCIKYNLYNVLFIKGKAFDDNNKPIKSDTLIMYFRDKKTYLTNFIIYEKTNFYCFFSSCKFGFSTR